MTHRPVSEMLGSQINKELDKLDISDSKLTNQLIEAGFGNVKYQDILKLDHPLAASLKSNFNRRMELRSEISRRYGQGAPSRLPKGFGPMKKNPKGGTMKLKSGYSKDDVKANVIALVGDGYALKDALSIAVNGAILEFIKKYPDTKLPEHLRTLKRNPKKKKSKSKFRHKHIASPSKFAKGSIRTIRRGKKEIRVGCPKGEYSKKTKRCRVGTRAVSILSPNPKLKSFYVFVRKGKKFGYWTGEGFDTNYKIALRYYRETAIHTAKAFARKYPTMTFGVSDGKA